MFSNHSIKMTNISDKKHTKRTASAICELVVNDEIIRKISNQEITKGDVISTAKIAGILAVKNTDKMIPLCHTIPISNAEVEIVLPEINAGNDSCVIVVKSFVESFGQTGVEMEALSAVTLAALTIYDMTKSISHGIKLQNIKLLEKKGGKSGDYFDNGINQ